MSSVVPDEVTHLDRQRRAVVQGFLWILLAVVIGTFVLNALLLGSQILSPSAFAPNLLFAAVLGASLWLNRMGRFRMAVGIVVGLILVAASVQLLAAGVSASGIGSVLFFIPLVLAGMLLGRSALYLTAGWALLVILAAPALQGADLLLGQAAATDDAWTIALQFAIVLATVTFFLDRFGLKLHETLRRVVDKEAALHREVRARLEASEALLEEQRFGEAIVESLPGLFYVVDQEGSYFRWNRNLVRALGYTEEELRHLRPVDLFDDGDKERVARRLREAFDTGHASTEAVAITKTGERIPYFVNATRVELAGSTYIAGIGIDRSEIDEARSHIHALNEELHERIERITALREIDRAITSSLDLSVTLEVVLAQVRSRMKVDAACILLYKPGSQTLQYGASQGFHGTSLSRTHLRLGEGLAGRAALAREPVAVDGAEMLERRMVRASAIEGEHIESYRALPLVARGELQGVLELFHREPLVIDDDQQDFLDALATQAALALDSAALFESLERSNLELRLAYDTTIEGWGRALDLKDEETEGHSHRVTAWTVRLAERMGVDEEQLVHLRRGALLHDIGKMGVPDRILLKPGKLDPDEWEVMKRHTTYAFRLLSPIDFLRPAIDIPYAHHEKWDGSGYPQGLQGEQIPVAARIFAVADVFDALTNDRPYRAAWTTGQALTFIREQSGRHFDPRVVEAFLALVGNEGSPASTSDERETR